VICEYHAEGVTAPAAMIRSGRWKLIVCRGDPDQLFDLSADPLEL
jgi:choline-sulfatase